MHFLKRSISTNRFSRRGRFAYYFLYGMIPLIISVFVLYSKLLIKDSESTNSASELPQLPEYIDKCLNKPNSSNYEHYLVAATLIQNKRSNIREWIEFHKLMGFSHFLFYDNGSEDGLKEFLQPYINDATASHIPWPGFGPEEATNDPELDFHYHEHLSECSADNRTVHRQFSCQRAAFIDAIRRTRNNTRWLASIDIDEYFYPPEASIYNSGDEKPLKRAFQTLEESSMVVIFGQHFGTHGWLSPPRRNDDSNHSQLLIRTHLRHMMYHSIELVGVREHWKPFVDPWCVYDSAVHHFVYHKELQEKVTSKYFHYDDHFLYLNHYNWPSMIETKQKALANKNQQSNYSPTFDIVLNAEEGSKINYLFNIVEEKIKESLKTHPPADGHADDWDPLLIKRHTIDQSKVVDICVVLESPKHIGLARQSLLSIINYFYFIEQQLNYKLIVHNAAKNILEELKRDFPVDLFLEKNIISLKGHCPSEYILHLREESFAKWEDWPAKIPAIKMALEVMDSIPSSNVLYLTSSSNLMSEWTPVTLNKVANIQTAYRINPGLKKQLGSYIYKNEDSDNAKIYEMCLDQVNKCYGNQIEGMFDHYHQRKYYNFPPGLPN